MRKILLPCFIIMLVSTSCGGAVTILKDIPVGLWKSEEPNLTLYISDDTSVYYHGQYVTDGEPVDIVVHVDQRGGCIYIYDTSVYDFSTKQFTSGIVEDNQFFIGGYKLKRGKLHYKIYTSFVEAKTPKTIIFENIIDEVSPNEIFGEILDESSEGGDVHGEKE